mgnify:CR=1 FL=1
MTCKDEILKRKDVLRRIVEAKYLEEGLRTEQGWEDMKGENTEEEHCVERKLYLKKPRANVRIEERWGYMRRIYIKDRNG